MRSPHPLLYPHALPPRARPVPPPPSSPSVQLLSLLIRANELGARVRLYPLAMSDAAGEAPLTVTVRHHVRTDHPMPAACGIDGLRHAWTTVCCSVAVPVACCNTHRLPRLQIGAGATSGSGLRAIDNPEYKVRLLD